MNKEVYSVHKRNGRQFLLKFIGEGRVIAYDLKKGERKEISEKTVARWHQLEEVKQVPMKKAKSKKAAKKSTGGVDRRKKVTEQEVIEMRKLRQQGMSVSKIAKQFGMSYSGAYWVVNKNTWTYVG